MTFSLNIDALFHQLKGIYWERIRFLYSKLQLLESKNRTIKAEKVMNGFFISDFLSKVRNMQSGRRRID